MKCSFFINSFKVNAFIRPTLPSKVNRSTWHSKLMPSTGMNQIQLNEFQCHFGVILVSFWKEMLTSEEEFTDGRGTVSSVSAISGVAAFVLRLRAHITSGRQRHGRRRRRRRVHQVGRHRVLHGDLNGRGSGGSGRTCRFRPDVKWVILPAGRQQTRCNLCKLISSNYPHFQLSMA